jgi:hypothetical protein
MEEGLQNPNISVFLEQARKDPRKSIVDFAKTVESLSLIIKEQEIQGDVLVAGHGGFVPERIFVATADSGFDEVKPEIESLTLIDDESSSNPEIYFSHTNGRIKAQTCTLQELADQLPEPKFDVVFFFRINNLQQQLEEGLLGDLFQMVKPGGQIIGSGGFVSEEEADKLLKSKFKVENLVPLPNPDYSGYCFNIVHLGFKLQKI